MGPVMLLQKRILDWSAPLPLWQRDLLRRLTSGPLDDVGRSEVTRILAGAPAAPAPVALELADLPADEGEQGRVELRAIRDLSNINCLASGQALRLESGLNVVFGDNGSGKSGYGRLTRRVTRSGEAEEVLRDVFDPGPATGPQTAQYDIAVDDAEQTIAVDLAAEPARVLSAVAAFDASRARLCLAKPNVIEHVPRPLRLLTLLSRTQDELAATLRDRSAQIHNGLSALPEISADTAAGRALTELNADTDAAAFVARFALSDQETATLEQLDAFTAAIATDQTRQLEAAARAQALAARSAADKLRDANNQLPVSLIERLAALRRRGIEIAAAERTLADRAFSDQRLEGTGQAPWREMWFAAERYAEAAGTPFPDPAGEAPCPLCQQDLDSAAAQRVQRFEEFISSDLRQQATQLDAQLAAVLDELPDVARLRATLEAELRGLPDPVATAATEALAVLEVRLAAARQATAGEPANAAEPAIDLEPLTDHALGQVAIAERHASLRDEERQRVMSRQREELRARVSIVAAAETVGQHIAGLRRIARVQAAIAQLNTQRISHKLRELQQVAITERLRKAVEDEVSELHPVGGKVEITGQASKGETLIHLTLKSAGKAKIAHVLSDGEQRALALAFFLAEVAVSDERSAIVLDDPVSSLDHDRRIYLAGRLVEESRRRQVIVFTHDMVFVHLLQAAAAEFGVDLHGQTLQRAFHRVGMVADELPLKMLGPAKQLRHLRHRLRFELVPKQKKQDPAYAQESDRWVADLRKAYDQIIEDTVLNGTVRRFNAHVRVRQLHGVKWTPDIAKRIDAGMRKLSPKAHYEALELHPAAHTPDELETMLDELTAVYSEMGGKSDEAPVEVPEGSGETEPVIRAVHRQT